MRAVFSLIERGEPEERKAEDSMILSLYEQMHWGCAPIPGEQAARREKPIRRPL